MKTIIVATDFSKVSVNAANFAADMAGVINARLLLFHVYALPVPIPEAPYPLITIGELENTADRNLSDLQDKLITHTGGRVTINTEKSEGQVIQELQKLAEKVNPYAIVIGSENAGAVERFLRGGKTIGAVRSFEWPVFVIPPMARFCSFRKIGLACDFRDVIDSVRVNEIKTFLEDFHASLHVLHVTEGDSYSKETIEESEYLRDMISKLNPKYHFFRSSDIVGSILAYVEDNDLDLLIVVPKKHDLLQRLFHQSLSKKLVMQAQLPVLSLHE